MPHIKYLQRKGVKKKKNKVAKNILFITRLFLTNLITEVYN